MNKHTILIVEDETSIAEIVILYLNRAGYQVTHAPSGEKAMELLENSIPDMVILDVMLPRIGGLEIVGSGWLIYRGTERSTFKQIDSNLLAHAELMARQVEFEHGGIVLEHGDRFQTEKGGLNHGAFKIWSSAGDEIAQYPLLDDLAFPRFGGEEIEFRDLSLPEGQKMRAISLRALPAYTEREGRADPEDPGTKVQIAVAHNITSELASLRRLLGVIGLTTSALLAIVIQVFTRSALRPIRLVRGELAARDGAALSSEITGGETLPDELVPLVESFNSVLGRIREASERERQFTSNAAHELQLRTPLAALSATFEQTVRRERSPEESHEAFKRSLALVGDMSKLVDRLLSLARLDSTEFEMEVSSVPLEILVEGAVETFRDAAVARDLGVECELLAGVSASTDPALLQVVINNLLETAVSYADAGSRIRISAENGGAQVRLTVANAAAIDDPANIDRIFKPFWRADQVRSRAGLHAGRGLSICKKIVEILGGTIRAEAPGGRGLTVTVELPVGS